MSTLVIELTNRCNLSCQHCLINRNNGDGDIGLEILEEILQSASNYGFKQLSFTGGEPTLHTHFREILEMTCNAGYTFGFVSNGWNFSSIYEKVIPYGENLTGITFSLDGAKEETHDRLRGKGSFRRLMSAVSICVAKDIPYTFNTLVTLNNRDELGDIADFAQKLGSRGLRFGHLMLTPVIIEKGLDLSPDKCKETAMLINDLKRTVSMPIVTAPGHYTHDLFPCDTLQNQECNVDWQGNMTFCCHLSDNGHGKNSEDIAGDLNSMSFSEAYESVTALNSKFRAEKIEHFDNSNLSDSDYFPCWYCLNYFRKIEWLKRFPENQWNKMIWKNNKRRVRINGGIKSYSKTSF